MMQELLLLKDVVFLSEASEVAKNQLFAAVHFGIMFVRSWCTSKTFFSGGGDQWSFRDIWAHGKCQCR